MRVYTTSASGGDYKLLDYRWENKHSASGRLTNFFFTGSATHGGKIYGYLSHNGFDRMLFSFAPSETTVVAYLWQPTLPLAVEPGDLLRVTETTAADTTTIRYIAGFTVEF